MSKITAERYHDISCGHRVVGHENKCAYLHGHNYRVHFVCEAEGLDSVGRVIDFSVIKSKLCMWLEDNWDHKFLHWEKDPLIESMTPPCGPSGDNEIRNSFHTFCESMVELPFNPTAENMAEYLVLFIGPKQLIGTGVVLRTVTIDETRKCSASFTREY